jgi:hypothetical protein
LIVGRTLAAVTAVVALATATTVAVVAAALALFFALEPTIGRAGAAAILAGGFALLVSVAVLIVASRGQHPPKHDQQGQPDFSFVERMIEIAKDKPILAAAGAVAAGLIVIRNPALVATIVTTILQKPKQD